MRSEFWQRPKHRSRPQRTEWVEKNKRKAKRREDVVIIKRDKTLRDQPSKRMKVINASRCT